VELAADGSYRIHVVPPAEKTQKTTTTTFSATCPIPNPAPPAHTDTFDWDPWVFEIESKLSDPKDRRHLEGQTVEMLSSSTNQSFALFGSADVGRVDGTNAKFEAVTWWKLSLTP
jgi:hypothetical protein